MSEFILFKGRIIRKDLVKAAYISFNPKDSTVQATVEFVGEPATLFLGQPTEDPKEALEVIYDFYQELGGGIGDVIKCREIMEDELNDEWYSNR